MSYRLPPNGQWTQQNIGDVRGSLWSSFNLDLTVKKGDTKITRLIHSQSTSADLANLGTPIGFVRIDTGGGIQNAPFWTVAGARVFSTSVPFASGAFSQDATSGSPTTCSSAFSDIALFNGSMYVTTTSNAVYKYNTGTWSNFTAGAADSNVHMLCSYANRMYMSRAVSAIVSWNTSDTVATSGQYTLTLPNANENVITFMRAASDRIWIGTMNIYGGQGHIYSWDGSSGNPVRYNLNSTGVAAGIVKDDVLYAVDNNGRLIAFNGGTFVEIARLPNYNRFAFTGTTSASNDRWMHPNGMAIVEDKILMLVNTVQSANGSPTEEMCPSGIWEYDKDIGLYHKYSFSYLDRVVESITDYGQSRISVAGGLGYAKNSSTSSGSNGILLAGCRYYTNASSTQYAIFTDDNNDNYLKAGYLVTTKLPAQGIVDAWQALALKYNNLYSASDKIVIKYRMMDDAPVEATITWVNTTSFTTTTDISAYWTSGTGYEVEIVQGTGAGMCSHITNIVNNAGTYTVTLDETHTGVTTGTAIARFQKWVKIDAASGTTQTMDWFGLSTTASSSWIQLKVWMLMYGRDELREINLQSTVSKPL